MDKNLKFVACLSPCLRLLLIFILFSFVFQTLAMDKEGLVKMKTVVKDIHKTGNSESTFRFNTDFIRIRWTHLTLMQKQCA